MKTSGFLAVCSALALAGFGCGDDGARPMPDRPSIELDGGMDEDGGGGGTDAGPGVDSGPVDECDVGDPCTPDRGCPRSPFCIDEFSGTVGTAGSDEIVGHPEGDTTVSFTSWDEGYCSTVQTIMGGGCDPNIDDSCGGLDCAVCLNAGTDASGNTITLCAASCTPSLTENTCRDGYNCALGNSACVPGCDTDDECAVYREDTNEDGTIDDGPAEGGVDRLVYDTDGNWTCDTTTNRCVHDGATGATAGDTCLKDTDCEARGSCLDEAGTDGDWPGGYCFKLGCDVAGNECAESGVCDDRAFGIPVCLAPCEVAALTDDTDIFSSARDCREGYSCFWDGASSAGADNGVCIPGNYNDVTTPNIGADCMGDEANCYSPYGMGQCRDWDGDDGPGPTVCTIFDCGAPGMPSDVCGGDAVCAQVSDSATTLCLQSCASAEDCEEGYGCWDTSAAGITTGGETVCFAGCLEDGDCRSGETCVGASMTMLGQCE